MSAQKRLRVRFSELDVLCGDDRAKTLTETALRENVPNLRCACARRDGHRTALRRGPNGCSGCIKQHALLGDHSKIMDAFSLDEFVQPCGRERPPSIGKKSLEA